MRHVRWRIKLLFAHIGYGSHRHSRQLVSLSVGLWGSVLYEGYEENALELYLGRNNQHALVPRGVQVWQAPHDDFRSKSRREVLVRVGMILALLDGLV
ncbi:hypothetical protein Plhal703r1_c04g0025171 [Plasmopara halstedii]